jgi:hypothetical protein
MLFENGLEIRELHGESIYLLRHVIKPVEDSLGALDCPR